MRVWTLAGTGEPGHRDGAGRRAQFYEPGGVSVAGDTVYVADTNNHVIRVVDARTGVVATIDIRQPQRHQDIKTH